MQQLNQTLEQDLRYRDILPSKYSGRDKPITMMAQEKKRVRSYISLYSFHPYTAFFDNCLFVGGISSSSCITRAISLGSRGRCKEPMKQEMKGAGGILMGKF